ncbi:MAG TPA: hypothetical protein VGE26_03330 [Sphingobacteriaceae bacterium]
MEKGVFIEALDRSKELPNRVMLMNPNDAPFALLCEELDIPIVVSDHFPEGRFYIASELR